MASEKVKLLHSRVQPYFDYYFIYDGGVSFVHGCGCLWRLEATESLGAAVVSSCRCCEPILGPLQGQHMTRTLELSPYCYTVVTIMNCNVNT